MEKFAGPVSGKNGVVLLYQATGIEMFEQRFNPKSLVLLKMSVVHMPVLGEKEKQGDHYFGNIFGWEKVNGILHERDFRGCGRKTKITEITTD